MNAPNAVSVVMLNENIKKIVQPKKRKNTFFWYFVCAGFAGKINYNYRVFCIYSYLPIGCYKNKITNTK
jgi:hypothetical protein